MDSEPIDFSVLDPSADPVRWEAMVAAVSVRAAPVLVRRARERSLFVAIAGWARPTLAAAAVLAAISGAILLGASDEAAAVPGPQTSVEEALQIGEPASLWLAEDRAPTTADLIAAVEDMP